jgi:CheY-like chemotaxis protein
MATVLIVDDVQTDRELIGNALTAAGYKTAFASDGDEVVAKAKQVRPNAILLDVMMQRLDGFALCRLLRADPETAKIPIVMVSSKATAADVFWGKKQGASDYLAKPFSNETLLEVVKRFAP